MHAAQAHVFHGEGGTWTQRRDGRGHTQARSERGARHAGTIDRFRDEGERLVLGRLDDDVIGLGIADLEFVHRDGPDIQHVGADHGYRQARRSEEKTYELKALMSNSYD